MPKQHKGSLLHAVRQEVTTMKQHTTIMFVTLVILAVAAVILVSRKDLCEIRYRTAVTEVAVSLACETLK